ncbi:TPA: aminoacylase [Vibrio parahaemolyticus]|uniref:aminoacylase n=1 Tax=Vibrio parahaemolyticus TaxID=670 RepID=UPI00215BA196|nr:aminoacylase [Vibrio parahaemolyticus]MBE3875374.1 hydrolase [Vibrio parahaemolyticus]MCR9717295.1 aminoacylase [Vibrio parahaemolyticus]MDG2808956.1 aminoacylase [Vibrio parahaemolyticus]HBN6296488.1 aminoacylase [Vibrio parahaemolyticus]HCG8476644.1 aminoacylase [Vibrio parahaemolyticus]
MVKSKVSIVTAIGIGLTMSFIGYTNGVEAKGYDLVINNGRVLDPETGYDKVANVGIKDGRIAIITDKNIDGNNSVDATGHVVAPGFIDTHFHWQAPLGYKIGLRDGLTSSMDLEEGCAGTTIGDWYQERIGKTAVNFGCASSHELARAIVLDGASQDDVSQGPMSALKTRYGSGWSSAKPNLEQGNEILRIIDKGLQDGGIGIGSTLGYMREGVTTREMFEVQKVAARYGRQTAVHTRFTPDDATFENLGMQEVIANALSLGAPAMINHFNNPGWELAHEVIFGLQQRGFNVWGEIYPYAAGSTTLNAVFLTPENWVDKLGHRYEDTLADAETGEFYTRETYEAGLKKNPTKEIILYKMPAEAAVNWLKLKGVTMASDGMNAEPSFGSWETPLEMLGNMHPRGAGARGSSVRLARENDIPLMQIMAILSYNAAKHLGDMGLKAMQERGRMQEGMIADIVVFHPEKFTDNSTYQSGSLPSTGMKSVVVNGTVVLKDDKILDNGFPGQPIRFEPQDKPRFEPLSIKAWKGAFMTGTPHMEASEFSKPK